MCLLLYQAVSTIHLVRLQISNKSLIQLPLFNHFFHVLLNVGALDP